MSDDNGNDLLSEHHKQNELCTTRPFYRQGRKLTAIKSYTINNESLYLLIFGVPKINLRSELKAQCKKYGALTSLSVASGYKTEQFTECFMVKFERIQSSRMTKRKLDMCNFFGGVLHVCYAPEMETVEETRNKLDQRKFEVNRQLIKYELSIKNVIDMLKTTSSIDSDLNGVHYMEKINKTSPLCNTVSQKTSNLNVSEISLCYSNNTNFSYNSFPSIGPVQLESIPNALPSVKINNVPFYNGNSTTVSYYNSVDNDKCATTKNLGSEGVFTCSDIHNDQLAVGNIVNDTYFQVDRSDLISDKQNKSFSLYDGNNCDHSLRILAGNTCTKSKDDQNKSLFSNSSKVTKDNKLEYVFKKKNKKSKNKVVKTRQNNDKIGSTSNGYLNFLNSVEILKDSTEKQDTSHECVAGAFGKVTVCDIDNKPRIIKLPPKPVNKIVFDIKHSKLL